jgi:hypothetical protein
MTAATATAAQLFHPRRRVENRAYYAAKFRVARRFFYGTVAVAGDADKLRVWDAARAAAYADLTNDGERFADREPEPFEVMDLQTQAAELVAEEPDRVWAAIRETGVVPTRDYDA